jgi:hypothetical protein
MKDVPLMELCDFGGISRILVVLEIVGRRIKMAKEMRLFYEIPVMVQFRDPQWELCDGEDESERPWICGIGHRDVIICGCCGSALDIEELLEDAEAEGIDLQYHELPWIDIKDEIRGDF